MPDQPERKIEELLRAYAAKRREDSGAPLELHPAHRKLLQAEVARLRQVRATPPVSGWVRLLAPWPRLAFAAAVAAMLGVCVWWMSSPPEEPTRLAKQDVPAPAPMEPVDAAPQKTRALNAVASPRADLVRRSVGASHPAAPSPNAATLVQAPAALPSPPAEPPVALQIDTATARLRSSPAPVRSAIETGPAASQSDVRGLAVLTQPMRPGSDAKVVATDADSQSAPRLLAKGQEGLAVSRGSGATGGQVMMTFETAGTWVAQQTQPARQTPQDSARFRPELSLASTAADSERSQDALFAYKMKGPALTDALGRVESDHAVNWFALNGSATAPNTALPALSRGTGAFRTAFYTAELHSEATRTMSAGSGVGAPALAEQEKRYGATGFMATGGRYVSTQALATARPQPATVSSARSAKPSVAIGGVSGARNEVRGFAAGVRYRFVSVQEQDGKSSRTAPKVPMRSVGGFEVERRGERISLLDADGSVYEGEIVEQSESIGATDKLAESAIKSLNDVARREEASGRPARETNAAVGRIVAFRAVGTNRTLCQPVSVQAVVRAAAVPFEGAGVSRTRALPAAPPVSLGVSTESKAEVWQMEGRVRVGTNESTLHAVRRMPERR